MNTQKLFVPLLFAAGLTAFGSGTVQAQEYHNTTETINGNFGSASASVEIGPNAVITVNGDWFLTASTVTINPGAQINGTGTLHLMTPESYNKAAAATNLTAGGFMGNGNGISCKLSLENRNGVVLNTGTGSTNSNLVMNNNLSFANAGAHLTLNGNSLIFRSGATAIPTITNATATTAQNFPNQGTATTSFSQAYIVTNGAGSVTKQGLAATTGSFTFPVGFSRNVTTPDYTPATVTNTAAAVRDLSTRVQDYASSTPVEGNTTKGVNRTWQIAGSTAGSATIALTHNAGTEGSAFNSNAAFVTQFSSAGWSVGMPMAATMPNFTHTGTFATVPTMGDATYFSKSSDTINSLNPVFTVAVKLFLQGPYINSSNPSAMTNSAQTGTVGFVTGCKLPTTDPYGLNTTYTDACNVAGAAGAVTDWIREELWGFNNGITTGTLLQSRAALLKTNGQAVTTDGNPLGFRVNAGFDNYRIVVRHRNHMAVSSQNLSGVVDGAALTYDFTTTATQAFASGNTPQQLRLTGTQQIYALFAGDANNNRYINGQDQAIFNSQLNAGTGNDEYIRTDFNINGFTNGQDGAIFFNNLNQGLFSETINY